MVGLASEPSRGLGEPGAGLAIANRPHGRADRKNSIARAAWKTPRSSKLRLR